MWADVELGFAVFGAWCMLAMFIGALVVTLRTHARRVAARRELAARRARAEDRVSRH